MEYGIVEREETLAAILQLQQQNLAKVLPEEDIVSQGFVTVRHNLDLLRQLNTPYPHIVAHKDGVLAGYALVMRQEMRYEIPILVSLFEKIDGLHYKGQALKEASYFVMGQVCVAKACRGQGVFRGLYEEMRKRMAPHFQYVLTEIDINNQRSIRAHQRIGFETLHRFRSEEGIEWAIVILNLQNK